VQVLDIAKQGLPVNAPFSFPAKEFAEFRPLARNCIDRG
jgi:hypothetical protein